jgi:hypothetical protein
MNLQQFLTKANSILESRGQDLRDKYGLNPGQASATLAKTASQKAKKLNTINKFDTKKGDNLLMLSGRARTRSQGKTSVGARTNSKGQLRDIRSRGGRPSNTYNDGEDRDRGDKENRFAQWASGTRKNPNMTDSERKDAHNNRKPRSR